MKKLIVLLSFALMAGVAHADGICYGTLDGICRVPDVRVEAAEVITLPGDMYADTAVAPATLTVTLHSGQFASAPVIVGDAVTLVSSGSTFVASGAGPFALTGLKISGSFAPGDSIDADVRLVYPNAATLISSRIVTLATIRGLTDLEILTINPAGNLDQQSLVRLANTADSPARVVLNPIDDVGLPGGQVVIHMSARASVQLNSEDLEKGNAALGVVGGFGHGAGKWRAHLVADQVVRVQSLVRNRSDGTLTNVSGNVQ